MEWVCLLYPPVPYRRGGAYLVNSRGWVGLDWDSELSTHRRHTESTHTKSVLFRCLCCLCQVFVLSLSGVCVVSVRCLCCLSGVCVVFRCLCCLCQVFVLSLGVCVVFVRCLCCLKVFVLSLGVCVISVRCLCCQNQNQC